MSSVIRWIETCVAFGRRHELSPARITGISVALTLHLLAFLLLMLPGSRADSTPDADEVVTTVQFVPKTGQAFRPAPPAPPPLPVKAPPKAPKAAAKAPPPPATPLVPDGEQPIETMHLTTMLADAEEMSSLDMIQPDSPPTEILSYRRSSPPTYPQAAIDDGEAGWVTLRVLVDIDGTPLIFVLVKTTATERLVEAAITAVKHWRFNPALKDGQPIPAWIEVPIGFFNENAPKQPVAMSQTP